MNSLRAATSFPPACSSCGFSAEHGVVDQGPDNVCPALSSHAHDVSDEEDATLAERLVVEKFDEVSNFALVAILAKAAASPDRAALPVSR